MQITGHTENLESVCEKKSKTIMRGKQRDKDQEMKRDP